MFEGPGGVTSCTTTFEYGDKSQIGFNVDNEGIHLFMVSEPTAKLTKGQEQKVSYRIDTGRPFYGIGVAADETTLGVIISGDHAAIHAALQAGRTLYVTLGGEAFEEPLEGSSNALNALGDCQSRLPVRGKK